MYELNYRMRFSAAHHLRNYKGICKNVHGHNWEVWVTLEGRDLAPDGTLIDFCDVERALQPIAKKLDHVLVNEIPPFTEISPTSENIARWIFDELRPTLDRDGVRLSRVTVEEYEGATVTYRPD